MTIVILNDLINVDKKSKVKNLIRTKYQLKNNVDVIKDAFGKGEKCSFFLRINSESRFQIVLKGHYDFFRCSSGGWILSNKIDQSFWWIPTNPMLRNINENQQIVSEQEVSITDLKINIESLEIQFDMEESNVLDLVFWYFSSECSEYLAELNEHNTLELQPYFIYGSHSTYDKPADLYQHLIYGYIYERIWSWPNKWKINDELDAYALYLILSGLQKATGKKIYSILKQQIIISVIDRQSKDGGFYHGEWTNQMEIHYRLHAGAVHLLAAAVEEYKDPVYKSALKQASDFLASRYDSLDGGVWLLHDSLETSQETIKLSPFKWKKSNVFGKSVSNMLVLNTHIDSSIAINHSQQILEQHYYEGLLSSTKKMTRKVIEHRPAEFLYRPLFWMIHLTLLPENRAVELPIIKKIIKRITWKYLFAYLCHVKAVFPRFIMPGGYIDRDIGLKNFSQYYQSVNVWDLIRYSRHFCENYLDEIIDTSLKFTQNSGIREFWKEGRRNDALVFWSEALYNQCLKNQDKKYRHWLVESVIDTIESGLGMGPSLLGCNAEAVTCIDQTGSIKLLNKSFVVINLCRSNVLEFIIINMGNSDEEINFKDSQYNEYQWRISIDERESLILGSKEWVHTYINLEDKNGSL